MLYFSTQTLSTRPQFKSFEFQVTTFLPLYGSYNAVRHFRRCLSLDPQQVHTQPHGGQLAFEQCGRHLRSARDAYYALLTSAFPVQEVWDMFISRANTSVMWMFNSLDTLTIMPGWNGFAANMSVASMQVLDLLVQSEMDALSVAESAYWENLQGRVIAVGILAVACIGAVVLLGREYRKIRESGTARAQFQGAVRFVLGKGNRLTHAQTNHVRELHSRVHALASREELRLNSTAHSEEQRQLQRLKAQLEDTQSMVESLIAADTSIKLVLGEEHIMTMHGDEQNSLHVDVCDIRHLCEGLVLQFKAAVPCGLRLTIADNVPDRLLLDSSKLSTVLNNALSNAIKFTNPEGEPIEVHFYWLRGSRASKLLVQGPAPDMNLSAPDLAPSGVPPRASPTGIVTRHLGKREDCVLYFEVVDNGPGPPNFDVFADHASRDSKAGTGVGLALAKHYAQDLLDGNIGLSAAAAGRTGARLWCAVPFTQLPEQRKRGLVALLHQQARVDIAARKKHAAKLQAKSQASLRAKNLRAKYQRVRSRARPSALGRPRISVIPEEVSMAETTEGSIAPAGSHHDFAAELLESSLELDGADYDAGGDMVAPARRSSSSEHSTVPDELPSVVTSFMPLTRSLSETGLEMEAQEMVEDMLSVDFLPTALARTKVSSGQGPRSWGSQLASLCWCWSSAAALGQHSMRDHDREASDSSTVSSTLSQPTSLSDASVLVLLPSTDGSCTKLLESLRGCCNAVQRRDTPGAAKQLLARVNRGTHVPFDFVVVHGAWVKELRTELAEQSARLISVGPAKSRHGLQWMARLPTGDQVLQLLSHEYQSESPHVAVGFPPNRPGRAKSDAGDILPHQPSSTSTDTNLTGSAPNVDLSMGTPGYSRGPSSSRSSGSRVRSQSR